MPLSSLRLWAMRTACRAPGGAQLLAPGARLTPESPSQRPGTVAFPAEG